MASPGWGSPSSSWFCFSSLILQRDKEGVRGDQQIREDGVVEMVGQNPAGERMSTCVGSAAGIS